MLTVYCFDIQYSSLFFNAIAIASFTLQFKIHLKILNGHTILLYLFLIMRMCRVRDVQVDMEARESQNPLENYVGLF